MDLSVFLALLTGVALGAAGAMWWRTSRQRGAGDAGRVTVIERASTAPLAAEVIPAPLPSAAPATIAAEAPSPDDVFALAALLENTVRKSPHPRDVLENQRFLRAVDLMTALNRPPEALVDYLGTGKVALGCIALEALARRTDSEDIPVITQRIPSEFIRVEARTAYFALRALATRATEPVIGAVLVRANKNWVAPLRLGILREFISTRLRQNETPSLASHLESLGPEEARHLPELVEALKDLVPSLEAEVRRWRESHQAAKSADEGDTEEADPLAVDTDTLSAIGRVWAPHDTAPGAVFMSDRLNAIVTQMSLSLRADPPRSVALLGDIGAGKTTLVRALAQQLTGEGWTVFEAGSVDLMAGQMFIGQIEERVKSVVMTLAGKRVLWVIPDFQDLAGAGAYKDNPSGVLDRLLPYVERGEIRVIAEMTPAAYERLLQLKPRVGRALVSVRVTPPPDVETLQLARQWASRTGKEDVSILSDSALRNALQLAKQFISDRAPPGNVLDLLKLTHQRLLVAGESPAITHDTLIVTLSQLTGLPASILDDAIRLDLDGLRAFFTRRVIGQPEAISALVERVAMMKAGVTDPTRAAGVFLFVGPTGTGKTEIAKSLAQYLFGSADRMIRLDMSELQTPESVDRIVGEAGERSSSTALVNSIRRQPFSVVLLDEFEKAHPNIWDLFLQVFDDGRLTDRRGKTADFRHAVIILTSNLGATLPHGAALGFLPGQTEFAVTNVDRAVADTFRKEFINRIDRVVVFRPLGRAEMREILHKELDDVFQRRGLRNRSWAVEWEASAIDFLLEKGFTPDLGARPLKRAIEQYLVAPLAVTIVNHRVPAGDQFLFVRSDGDRLDVVFIDPDVGSPGTELEFAL